jgi:hypothetical protein
MKTKLTNKLTKVFFYTSIGYCMIEFNGEVSEARQYIKSNYAAKIDYFYTVVRDGFLPVGYASFEII